MPESQESIEAARLARNARHRAAAKEKREALAPKKAEEDRLLWAQRSKEFAEQREAERVARVSAIARDAPVFEPLRQELAIADAAIKEAAQALAIARENRAQTVRSIRARIPQLCGKAHECADEMAHAVSGAVAIQRAVITQVVMEVLDDYILMTL